MLNATIQLREGTTYVVKKYFPVLLFFTLLLSSSCGKSSTTQGIEPVKNFNLKLYLGTWHEIARYKDHSFEKDLEQVTATYTQNADGSIEVKNAGTKKNGKRKTKIGKAKFVGEPTTGHLKVSFFRPFYGDYIIFYLEDYSVALVTSDNKEKYCWILARKPVLSPEELKKYIQILKERGFDTNKLVYPAPYQSNT